MRSIEQIIHDNGGDNTPALDTHNLTGRASTPYEPEWTPLAYSDEDLDVYEYESYEQWLGGLDCE